jgi:ribonuclease P protein component
MTDPERRRAPRVGFVVSKAVGNAVVRNRVTRRLRAIAAPQLGGIPAGVDVVVRALPPAAGASFVELEAEAGRLLARSVRVAAGGAR